MNTYFFYKSQKIKLLQTPNKRCVFLNCLNIKTNRYKSHNELPRALYHQNQKMKNKTT